MALDWIIPLATNLLVISALTLLFVQTVSLIWAASLARSLSGQEGGRLARLLTFMAAAIFVGQGLSLARAVLLASAPIETINLRILLFLTEEIVLIVVSLSVMFEARALRQPPVDRPREAVVEEDAQAVAQVPPSTDNVGTPVDDPGLFDVAVPAELDEGAAG